MCVAAREGLRLTAVAPSFFLSVTRCVSCVICPSRILNTCFPHFCSCFMEMANVWGHDMTVKALCVSLSEGSVLNFILKCTSSVIKFVDRRKCYVISRGVAEGWGDRRGSAGRQSRYLKKKITHFLGSENFNHCTRQEESRK